MFALDLFHCTLNFFQLLFQTFHSAIEIGLIAVLLDLECLKHLACIWAATALETSRSYIGVGVERILDLNLARPAQLGGSTLGTAT